MADKHKKEATPPPLLLMPPGRGLSFNPPDHPNLLMPVVQPEPSLLDEDCEADSFVGQGPPACQGPPRGSGVPQGNGGTNPSFFKSGAQHPDASDPFAHVGQVPPLHSQPSGGFPAQIFEGSAPLSGGAGFRPGPPFMGDQGSGAATAPPVSFSGPGGAVPPLVGGPPTGGSTNMYRQKGHKLRYAQPPAGTYASSQSGGLHDIPTPSVPPTTLTCPPLSPPSSSSPFMIPSSSSSCAQGPYSRSSPSPPDSSLQQPPAPMGMMVPGMGMYQMVRYHWCYKKVVEGVEIWYTFSALDSSRLEEQFLKENNGGTPKVISTDGGRYDVDVQSRLRHAVYWEEDPATIQRCSWFNKREGDSRYVPYSEAEALQLEAEYKNTIERNEWHKRIELPGKDTIVMHNPSVIVHFQAASQPDEWGNVQQVQKTDQMRPRVVKRGVDDLGTIEDGESVEVDHLVFLLHGIGDMCDVRFRNIIECVDDFRTIANSLIKSHFGPYAQSGHIHRVEFLPVYWHMAVHSEATGIDSRLKTITLPSTRKLRDFVNDTLMDILFYTSPVYCQIICDTAGQEMNRLFQIFLARNPTFSGEVSLAGHSLGATILFDLLMHQYEPGESLDTNGFKSASDSLVTEAFDNTATETEAEAEGDAGKVEAAEPQLTLELLLQKVGLLDKMEVFQQEQIDLESLSMCSEQDLKDLGLPMGPRKKLILLLQEGNDNKEKKKLEDLEKKIREELEKKLKLEKKKAKVEQANAKMKPLSSISVDYICGVAGTGQPFVRYPQLEFSPTALFALGSPIGVFLSARGVTQMGENFKLPTCPKFFNIFHPFDPVAYRLEPLISAAMITVKPVLVPHYKGRKRLHLELKDSITRMGTDLKQRIVESLRSTWNSLHDFARAHRSPDSSAAGMVSGEEDSVNSQGLEKELDQQVDSVMAHMVQQHQDVDKCETSSICSSYDDEFPLGQLNEGRRIDYVLQEKPIESFNDYLFALATHGCYWTSEDTVLLILKEIYSPLGILPLMPGPDSSVPKPVLSNSMGPFPRPLTPSSSADNSQEHCIPPLQPTPSGSSHGLPFQLLGIEEAPPPLMAGPGTYFAPAYTVPESQGSSRGSTPVGSVQGMVMPASNQGINPGPPPLAGFLRTSPKQH